ncbi:MAG: ATP-binding protein [Spirochaetaceae bacterium]|nr:ATP-binding protein [Spirochaetaceae bacterium]
MSQAVHLQLDARPEELPRVVEAVEEMAERDDWAPKLLFQVNLVLEELALNVMTHGRDGGARHLDVILGSTPNAVTVELVDDGPRFDPLQEAPEFDADLSIDERRIGGVGVHLVRTLVDDVRYRYEEGRNRLTLVLPRSAEG